MGALAQPDPVLPVRNDVAAEGDGTTQAEHFKVRRTRSARVARDVCGEYGDEERIDEPLTSLSRFCLCGSRHSADQACREPQWNSHLFGPVVGAPGGLTAKIEDLREARTDVRFTLSIAWWGSRSADFAEQGRDAR
jgi:hypothetical protein